MSRHSLVLADAARAEQFDLLGRGRRLFSDAETVIDDDGVGWAVAAVGTAAIALTWLGPGAVFDADTATEEEVAGARARLAAMAGADAGRYRRELAAAAARLRETDRVSRVLWSIHGHVLAARSAAVNIPDVEFAAAVWGADRAGWPANWRAGVLSLIGPLTRVHLFDGADGATPRLGADTALLHRVRDLRGSGADRCGPLCPAAGRRHHHVSVHVGRGFLGVLEQFAHEDGSGVRTYRFPVRGGRKGQPTLRRVGKTGRLVTVYLPAEVALPADGRPIPPGQRRLLRVLVRELTRAAKPAPEPGEYEPVSGGKVPNASGRVAVCGLLDPARAYAAFGGNGVRRGQGYRLTSAGGWLAKAGYPPGDVAAFLADLAAVAARFGLTAVGLDPATGAWSALAALRGMAAHAPGRRTLDRVHLRVYGPAAFVDSWNELFGWRTAPSPAAEDPAAVIVRVMTEAGLSRRAVATGIGGDPSLFGKILNGAKRCPPGWAERALAWISSQLARQVVAPPLSAVDSPAPSGTPRVLDAALAYHARGWSVIPVRRAEKRPYIKWKEFQTRLATPAELTDWFGQWPNAGVALVLGPVSNVFAIDVDGPEAHAALGARLGTEPAGPRSVSGSRQPCRYHLLFTDPGVPTRAKATPWHPKLEFRGRGGLVVLPPSVHPSGHRYEWCAGRSPADVPLPAVPDAVRAALAPAVGPTPSNRSARTPAPAAGAFSTETARFLAGEYADGPNWNNRLFTAACDLAARGFDVDEAEPLLLAGAAPRNQDEADAARRTVQSAYSAPRVAART